ncbi:MAG: hypothetical protein WC561_01900 [Candidatus Omnitrophota bacterium]|jgi:hypothetical protein
MSLNKVLLVLLILVVAAEFACCQEEFVYNSKGKRNPFIPLVSSEGRLLKLDKREAFRGASATGALSLEGIIYDKFGRSFAIVNASVVGIGDSVGDYQVLKIYANKVIFIKDGEPLEVELIKREAE